jgi:hypothetical protein
MMAPGGPRQARQPLAPGAGRAQERGQAHRAPPVQLDVVLPRVADSAEQGDGVQGDVDRGRRPEDGGHRGGQRELPLAVLAGDGGVPRGGREELGAGIQPGAPVLDRLEGADGGAEPGQQPEGRLLEGGPRRGDVSVPGGEPGHRRGEISLVTGQGDRHRAPFDSHG